MVGVQADDVRAALRTIDRSLRPFTGHDWHVRAGDLEWTVAEVMDHLVDVCSFYAVHLAARSSQRLRFDGRPHSDADNVERLDCVAGAAMLLAVVIDAMPADARGWHFHGVADRLGFGAMACDELLVHGWDAAVGLGAQVRGEDDLCRRVLARLFPGTAVGADPWSTLLWANGRVELAGKPRRTGWRYQCAPVEELPKAKR